MAKMTPDITKAADLLRAGGLVAFPTETVYGLGADASHEAAVRKIFRAKERPFNHPLIVHIASLSQLGDWACDISPLAMRLARACWPGPLTLILKKQAHVLDIVTGGQESIGLRMPKHPMAQALLRSFGGGVAAPSANKFTHISPTTASAVQEELGNSVDLILDGGDCAVGLESTIIDMRTDEPVILRPGMITTEKLSTVLGKQIVFTRQDRPAPRTPGMHHLHYAPTTITRLIATQDIPAFLQTLKKEDLPIALLTHSKGDLPLTAQTHRVVMPNEAALYAHDLYHTLRTLDHQQFNCIVIEAVPNTAEWEAIRDRVTKASGERR